MGETVRAVAPGRVNLIGEHTDYTGGLAMPMAVDLATEVTGTRGGPTVRLRSAELDGEAIVPLDVDDPSAVRPAWARYVAGVVRELHPAAGFVGTVSTRLPVGGGLSSSAALELAVALALGFDGTALDLAALGQRAEQAASGVPCGIMDQLASAMGIPDHALLVDFTTLAVEAVPVPDGASVVVVDSGEPRALADSAYADRRRACELAADIIGPLRDAEGDLVDSIADPVLQARARHVVSENRRVRDFAAAFRDGDLAAAGALMVESHRSLRDDFEVSTPTLDHLVDDLVARPGVHGARLTGAGFGGCVVALTEAGALPGIGWHVRASGGARVLG